MATTYYEIDGGTQTLYPGSAVTIPDGSAQTISYWSVDNAGNTETTNTTSTLKIDTDAPSHGAVTVNGVAATSGGSTSTSTSTSFAINSRTDYTDTGSGLASSTLTVQSETLTGRPVALPVRAVRSRRRPRSLAQPNRAESYGLLLPLHSDRHGQGGQYRFDQHYGHGTHDGHVLDHRGPHADRARAHHHHRVYPQRRRGRWRCRRKYWIQRRSSGRNRVGNHHGS